MMFTSTSQQQQQQPRDYYQQQQSQQQQQQPPPMVASITSNEDDIEGGSCASDNDEEGGFIVPQSKSVSSGRFVRRQSQELKLSHRRSSLEVTAKAKSSSFHVGGYNGHFSNNGSINNNNDGDNFEVNAKAKSASFHSHLSNNHRGSGFNNRGGIGYGNNNTNSGVMFGGKPRAPASIPVNFGGSQTPRSMSINGVGSGASVNSNSAKRSSFRNSIGHGIAKMVPNTIHIQNNDCLPMLSSNKYNKSYNHNSLSKYLKLSLFSILLLLSTLIYQHQKLSKLQTSLHNILNSKQHLFALHKQTIQDLATANENVSSMRNTLEQMSKASAGMKQYVKQIEEEKEELIQSGGKGENLIKSLEKKKEVAEKRMESVIKGIQDRSRKAVIEKYGKGPHKVQFQVQLPSTSPTAPKHNLYDNQDLRTIDIELAPLDLMPHSVHTFLEQVDSKAWDGTQFDLHAGHVLLARPVESDGNDENNNNNNSNNNNDKKILQHQVPVVSFPEYSTLYPHDRYTIAFPGRPNTGQDFYINLIPNTPYHSPRTTQDGNYIEGEPCFGKIVGEESRKVVDEMDKLSVFEGVEGKGNGVLERPVKILSAKVVSSPYF